MTPTKKHSHRLQSELILSDFDDNKNTGPKVLRLLYKNRPQEKSVEIAVSGDRSSMEPRTTYLKWKLVGKKTADKIGDISYLYR